MSSINSKPTGNKQPTDNIETKSELAGTAPTFTSRDSFISSLLDLINPNSSIKLLEKVKLQLSDAATITKSFDLAPGTYNVYDINKTLIAYTWYQENKEEIIIVPLHNSFILKKRVN